VALPERMQLPVPWVPRVSVVMPAYNSERYIASAILSALAGAGTDVEVVVVNDGSTDRTVATVEALNDPRVSVISIAASGGPSRPRNVGVAHARAPLVSLLDSDDLLKPGKLLASADALDACPSAGFAFGNYEKMDADGNVFETSMVYAYPVFRGLSWSPVAGDWRLIAQAELARGLIYENFVGTSSVVARKELVTRLGGFDESLSNGDDLDLWFRLAHECGAVYSPRIGHSYRVHATSVVHGPPLRNAAARLKVLRRERARWQEPAATRQLDLRIAENLGIIGYQHRRQGQRMPAIQSYYEAFRTSAERRWITNMIAAMFLEPDEAVQS
jgi:glycosyltransferase involved in cell wall biosynthesis